MAITLSFFVFLMNCFVPLSPQSSLCFFHGVKAFFFFFKGNKLQLPPPVQLLCISFNFTLLCIYFLRKHVVTDHIK